MEKDYRDKEKLIDVHSVFCMKMFRVREKSEKSGDSRRLLMKTENRKCSMVNIYRKHHKPYEEREERVPRVSTLRCLSFLWTYVNHFISIILKEVMDKEQNK